MTELIEKCEEATPGAPSDSISLRLQAMKTRPQALTVHVLVNRYMAQYSGRDPTRPQRLRAWQAMIGDLTLEQVDSDLIHVCRAELQTKPPLLFVGLDHLELGAVDGVAAELIKHLGPARVGAAGDVHGRALVGVHQAVALHRDHHGPGGTGVAAGREALL